ncbi:MAG: hypothetical protein ACLR4Z_11875 [Butyricicoccaceae bacterium]
MSWIRCRRPSRSTTRPATRPPLMSSASGASVTVSLVDLDKRDRSAQDITKQLRRDLADIAVLRDRSLRKPNP